MKIADKQALRDWEAHKQFIFRATSSVPIHESIAEKEARKTRLLSDVIEFARYYFPHYCSAEFAPFQKRFLKKMIKEKRIFAIWRVSRSHAKSVIAGVVLPAYLMFNGDLKNGLLASYNEGNAITLLNALQSELEKNQLLIHDFGVQENPFNWKEGDFVTKGGVSWKAIGSGQSPRGTRNEQYRPDFILCDDLDEDEQSRNPKRMQEAYEWTTGSLYGCFDIAGNQRFIMVNNRIASDTLLDRCEDQADWSETINILDANGQPSWIERYSLADCQRMIDKMGYRMSQRELFNNPINEGKVFKKEWMQFKKMPPLSAYRHLVAYLDPGFKKTNTSDSKSLILMGLYNGEFHIRKVFCGKASVEEMIDWCYAMDTFIKQKNAAYRLKMEEVFLQSLLYKDFAEAAKRKKYPVPVSGDKRKKPDKDARIEATSGFFERGQVFFDADIEQEHHTKQLITQYLAFEPGVKTLKDGPDAAEGAFNELQNIVIVEAPLTMGKFKPTNKRI